jgi:hypothetical protein
MPENMKAGRRPARGGRPPAGSRGEKVSDYPQVMIRLPQATKDVLDALSGATGTPVWRLIDTAVDAYVRGLPDAQRQLVARVQSLRAATGQVRPE